LLSCPDAADASLAVELSGNIPGGFPDVDFTGQGFDPAHPTCLFRGSLSGMSAGQFDSKFVFFYTLS
jgi:hypothetical protein